MMSAEKQMEIQYRAMDELSMYEKNPRKNDKAVKDVVNSIREFGFKVPIIIDRDDVIVAGHTRYKAARKLGMDAVPCIVADDLTPEQVKAFRLADNKTGEIAEWDFALLGQELQELQGLMDFEMSDFGFDALISAVENDPYAEYVGMPEYKSEDKMGVQSIVVHFATREDVQAFAELVQQPITEKTRYLWYPAVKKQSQTEFAYE